MTLDESQKARSKREIIGPDSVASSRAKTVYLVAMQDDSMQIASRSSYIYHYRRSGLDW